MFKFYFGVSLLLVKICKHKDVYIFLLIIYERVQDINKIDYFF